jgi:hypothetical protein
MYNNYEKKLLGNFISGWPMITELVTMVVSKGRPFKLSMLITEYYILQVWFSEIFLLNTAKLKEWESVGSLWFFPLCKYFC